MEMFSTIVAGAGTFVLGQIVLKLLIDPVQSFKATVAEIANKLIFYANIYANPKPLGDEKQTAMSEDFRVLSSKLQSHMHQIPAYNISRCIFGLPSKKQVATASSKLIFLHNGHDGALENQGILNCYAAQKVRNSLGVYIPEGEYLNPKDEASFLKAKGN
ncbi:MAG: hypothetical protein WAW02_01195 [Sideroxyarcus sp.]